MILSTHGIVGSQILQIDPDYLAFYNRVIAAGGSLSTTEQTATQQLILDMKSYGIWTKMKAIYPMVGASSAACSQNLKSSSFTGTFTSGWTFASTGATPNGTSAYFNTLLNPKNELTFNSVHLSFYSRSNTANGDKTEIGSIENTGSYIPLSSIAMKRESTEFISIQYSYVSGQIIKVSNNDSKGFYLNSRISSTNFKAYKNNSNVGTITAANNQTAAPNNNYFIGATNSRTAAAEFSDRECAFASIGDGLTDTEASNFYTAVQAFQVSLSRSV